MQLSTTPKNTQVNIFLLVGWAVFSVLILIFNLQQDIRSTLTQLEHDINIISQGLVSRLQSNTAVINSLSADFIAHGELRYEHTRTVANKVLAQYPHIYMFEIAEKVAPSQLTVFEQQKREQGNHDFRVKSFTYDTDRTWTSPGKDSEIHYPLVFIEPVSEQNAEVIGLDTYSVPNLKEAMERARIHNTVTSSRPFNLVEGNRAYILFKPVYNPLTLNTNTEESQRPDYYALVVINNDALMQESVLPADIYFNLYHADFTADNSNGAIFVSRKIADSSIINTLFPRLTDSRKIDVEGQHFVLSAQKQMGWADVDILKLAFVLLVSVSTLVFTLLFIRSRSLMEAIREDRDRSIYSLAKHSISDDAEELYKACVKNLAKTYHVRYALIGLIADKDKTRLRTLAVWAGDDYADNFEYELEGTPCADVINRSKEFIPRCAVSLYPEDRMLADMGVESYYGAPLINGKDEVIGLVSIFDTAPMELSSWTAPVLGIFSERISAEIDRFASDKALRELNEALERRVEERTEEYRFAKIEAERANQAKSDFLSHMSHEFRTPMNAVIGFSELIKMDNTLKEQNREYLEEIISAGRHMLELINEILDLASIEAGMTRIELVDADFGIILARALSLIDPIAEQQEISIECAKENNAGVTVRVDSIRLTQVLLNLFSNAIKYNRPQGKVWLTCGKDSDYLYLYVHDNGVGLTHKQIEVIFDHFNRAGSEYSAVSGTGIGLSISKKLMQLMGGDITAESQPGIDTCFTVKIPLSKQH